ncbi:MAG TPA: oxidoreductase-like domain-containing protein [Burkholderiales bacterium]|nr:oxidoreductase-like domain-containing protein [Burkholderiales bacterium]
MAQLPSSLSEARAVISTVRAKAFARHAAIPDPPEEPLPADCCERGCDRCVFTVYYEAIDAWRRGIESAWR